MVTGTGFGDAIENIAPVMSIRVLGPGACRSAKFSTKSTEMICTSVMVSEKIQPGARAAIAVPSSRPIHVRHRSNSVHCVCGRFTSLTPPEQLAEMFDAELSESIDRDRFGPNYNVAPSTRIFVVAHSPSRGRTLGQLRWGLIPEWAKELRGTGQINARSETVSVKPTFRNSFRKRRCIIPMSGYYEWRTVSSESMSVPVSHGSPKRAPKRAVYVTRRDGRPLAVAGLWSSWADRARSEEHPASTLKTCCVMTAQAVGALATVHDRMPVILDEDQWPIWLGESEDSTDTLEQVQQILSVPQHADGLDVVDVGPLVNSNRNNGPELIIPVS